MSFHVPSRHVVSHHAMSRHVASCYFLVHTVSSEHVDSMKEIDNVFSETMMQAGGKKLATPSKIMSHLHTFTIASAHVLSLFFITHFCHFVLDVLYSVEHDKSVQGMFPSKSYHFVTSLVFKFDSKLK